MMRKLLKWFLTIGLGMCFLPFGACLGSAPNGLVQSFKVCDVFNCQNPNYFDPCDWLQCGVIFRPPTFGEIEIEGTDGTGQQQQQQQDGGQGVIGF